MQKFMFFCLSLYAVQSWSGTGCKIQSGEMCYPQETQQCDCVEPSNDDRNLKSRIKEHFKDEHQGPIKTYIKDKQQ